MSGDHFVYYNNNNYNNNNNNNNNNGLLMTFLQSSSTFIMDCMFDQVVIMQCSKLRLFWSPWRIEKNFGDQNCSESHQFGNLCSAVMCQVVVFLLVSVYGLLKCKVK